VRRRALQEPLPSRRPPRSLWGVHLRALRESIAAGRSASGSLESTYGPHPFVDFDDRIRSPAHGASTFTLALGAADNPQLERQLQPKLDIPRRARCAQRAEVDIAG